MKQFICFLFVLCMGSYINAQETKMIVDNQYPGWLSSLIPYSQQKNLEELTITGYVNKQDMDFVSSMIKNHNLVVLDLFDANLAEAEFGDDCIWSYFIKGGMDKKMQRIRLPYKVAGFKLESDGNGYSKNIISALVDTLEIAIEDLNHISCTHLGAFEHLILLDGVKTIPDKAFYFHADYEDDYYGRDTPTEVYHVSLSNTIEKIGGRAFGRGAIFDIPFTFPDSIEYIGEHPYKPSTSSVLWGSSNSWNSFGGVKISDNRFEFPQKMKYYNGKGIDKYESDTIVVYEACDTLYANLTANVAFFYNKKPIKYYSSGDYCFNTLYVPEGSLNEYMSKYNNALSSNHGNIKQIKEMKSVKAITINARIDECYVGDNIQLYATVSPQDAFNKVIHWESSDSSIAIVDNKGLVKAKKAGTVEIYAISNENTNIKGVFLLNVLQHVEGIYFTQDQYTFNKIGDTMQMEAIIVPSDASNKEIEWKSSNENVCIVSKGKVVAVGEGISVIIATTIDGNYMATCTINVDTSSCIFDNEYCRDAIDKQNSIFDLQGIKHNNLQKGINLIKQNDGSIKKIIIQN